MAEGGLATPWRPMDYVPGRASSPREQAPSIACGVDVALVLTASEHVLLVQGTDGLWRLVSGVLEAGEDVAATAVRCASDSLGLRLDRSELALLGVVHCRPPRTSPRLGLFFMVGLDRSRHGNPSALNSSTGLPLGWSRLDRLPHQLAGEHAAGLELYLCGERYGALGWEIP